MKAKFELAAECETASSSSPKTEAQEAQNFREHFPRLSPVQDQNDLVGRQEDEAAKQDRHSWRPPSRPRPLQSKRDDRERRSSEPTLVQRDSESLGAREEQGHLQVSRDETIDEPD